jgi:hypothetical protein
MAVKIQIDFTDTEEVVYKIEIGDPEYTGTYVRQVQGRATLEYPKVKTMDIIRGSSLKMELEASLDSSYYDFLVGTVGDKVLPVTLYRSGGVFWKGFVKPDGIVESFVDDYWYVNVQAIDGLGYLENVQFLDSAKNAFFGAKKELEILTRCLQLTGLEIDFRLYDFHLYFTTNSNPPQITNNPIIDTYVNTERYINDDKAQTVFTAKEVLESVLKKYGAYVVQVEGKWQIVRLEHYFSNETSVSYFEFDSDGISTGVQEAPARVLLLGSQINDFYPHHADGNQQKFYNVSLGAYKVIYKYGLVRSLVLNRNVYFDDGSGNITNWVITPINFATSDKFNFLPISSTPPGYPNGYFIGNMYPVRYDKDYLALKSTTLQRVNDNSSLSISIGASVTMRRGGAYMEQFIKITLIGDSGVRYYLDSEGAWGESSSNKIQIYKVFNNSLDRPYNRPTTFEGTTLGIPEAGDLEVHFYLPKFASDFVTYNYSRITSVNITKVDDGITGESHTSKRGLLNTDNRTVTSVVESAVDVFVGDNPLTDAYVGGIEDSAGENTLLWSKGFIDGGVDTSVQTRLLEWMVRDRLQISSGNSLNFSGGVYGYLPYLGVITIDNIGTRSEPTTLHRFMTTEWSYDLARNKIAINLERIFNENILTDIDYKYSLETENIIIKPAVVG